MTRPAQHRPAPAIPPAEHRARPAVLGSRRPPAVGPVPAGRSQAVTAAPAAAGGEPPGPVPAGAAGEGTSEQHHGPGLQALLAERTADLQRVKAEYDNYRKRVRRDRLTARESAVADVLRGLLPVLDAVEEVRALGDMTAGFVAVADALETHVAALGLRSFGEPGEPFDPTRHLALYQLRSDRVGHATCEVVLRPGYRAGDTLLRPAHVVVVAPPAPGEESGGPR